MEERDSSDSEECSFFSIELRKPNSQWQSKLTCMPQLQTPKWLPWEYSCLIERGTVVSQSMTFTNNNNQQMLFFWGSTSILCNQQLFV